MAYVIVDDPERNRILREVDTVAFIDICVAEGKGAPTPESAEAAIHKVRCELARRGGFPKDLGAESGRWLEERGLWPGVRWWALEGKGSVH